MLFLLRVGGIRGWRRHLALPGKPDFVWRSRKVAVFVDGCFWHSHKACGRNLTPAKNTLYWRAKIRRNLDRDRYVNRQLRAQGWSVLRLWECALKRKPNACLQRVQKALHARQ